MPSSVEDLDTLTGFQTFYQASDALKAVMPGGLRRGLGKKGVDEPPGNPGKLQCWAQIDCTQGPAQNVYSAPVQSGRGYKDFRKVTITVHGPETQVAAALQALRTAFEWQPKGAQPMTIPNADYLVSVMPLPAGAKFEPDAAKKAIDVWHGVMEWQVCTGRKVP
jgi:hypothetical protein